jgi:hypothetical protein
LLAELGERLQQDAEFTEASTEACLRGFAEERGVKAGVLINGARVALTGQGVAPSLFAVMVALGRERTFTRLQAAHAAVDATLKVTAAEEVAAAAAEAGVVQATTAVTTGTRVQS